MSSKIYNYFYTRFLRKKLLVNDYYAISNSRLHLINQIKEMCSRYAQRKLVTDNESEKYFAPNVNL